MASRQVFRGRARFDPTRSLLGWFIRLRVRDERQAEAWYLIIVCTGIILSMVGVLIVANVWKESIMTDERAATRFWLWQWIIFGAGFVFGLLGISPGVRVIVYDQMLRVRQGRRSLELGFEDIERCQVLSARTYYREYALFADGERFMNRTPSDVLLCTVKGRHIAIGLSSSLHVMLQLLIQAGMASSVVSVNIQHVLHEV